MTAPQSGDRTRRRNLLAFAAACAVGVLVVYLLAVRTHTGQDLDASAYGGPFMVPGIGFNTGSKALETISAGSLVLATALLVLLSLVRGRPSLAVVVLATIGGSLLATELLKHEILTRPGLLVPWDVENSYPSGHTTVATAIGIAAMFVVPAWLRPAALLGAVAYASVIGVSAVATGWHRPSDIAGAYLVTVAVAAIAIALFGSRSAEPDDPERRVRGALALGTVVGVLVAFGAGIADGLSELNLAELDRGLIAFAVILPITAAGLICTLAWLSWGSLRGATLAARKRDR